MWIFLVWKVNHKFHKCFIDCILWQSKPFFFVLFLFCKLTFILWAHYFFMVNHKISQMRAIWTQHIWNVTKPPSIFESVPFFHKISDEKKYGCYKCWTGLSGKPKNNSGNANELPNFWRITFHSKIKVHNEQSPIRAWQIHVRAYVRTRKLGISPPRTSLKNSVNVSVQLFSVKPYVNKLDVLKIINWCVHSFV